MAAGVRPPAPLAPLSGPGGADSPGRCASLGASTRRALLSAVGAGEPGRQREDAGRAPGLRGTGPLTRLAQEKLRAVEGGCTDEPRSGPIQARQRPRPLPTVVPRPLSPTWSLL